MSGDVYDVIVVGAGPGGTTAAALLAHGGKRVLLVDKNPRAGGRMMLVERDGFSFELFPINCVPQHGSLFERLSGTLGISEKVRVIKGDDYDIGRLFYENRRGEITSWTMNVTPLNLVRMLGFLGVRLWDLRSIARMARVARRMLSLDDAEIAQLYDISAMDYFDGLGPVPAGFRTVMLATFGEGAFEMTSDRIAAGEMVKMFQLTVKGSGGRYYEGGVGRFFAEAAKTVEDNGGTVLMDTRVASIDTEESAGHPAARGIVTEDGKAYRAPVVISNAGIRQTVLKLVGEEAFPDDYVSRVRGLESNLACVGYRYFTTTPVLEYPTMVLFPEGCVSRYEEFEKIERGEIPLTRGYVYVGTTSLYPGTAPQGKQLIYAVVSCLPDPEIEPQKYLDYIEERVRTIVPELYEPGVIYRTQVMSPKAVLGVGNDAVLPGQGGESYGIANTIGQAGPDRPSPETPVSGLYVVGNDAAGFGLGTHQAVDSGFTVAELVARTAQPLGA